MGEEQTIKRQLALPFCVYFAIRLYLIRFGSSASAPSAFLVLFVLGKVTFEELNLTFILVIQNVGGNTVKEPAVVRDNHRAARELQQGVFQRAQGFDIQVVGWFIEQQDVTADLQQFRQGADDHVHRRTARQRVYPGRRL